MEVWHVWDKSEQTQTHETGWDGVCVCVCSAINLITGWQGGLEIRKLTSKLSSQGLNSNQAINCHPSISSMSVPSLGWTLNWASHLPALVGGR